MSSGSNWTFKPDCCCKNVFGMSHTFAVFLSTGLFRTFLIWKVWEKETSFGFPLCWYIFVEISSEELISRSASVLSSSLKFTENVRSFCWHYVSIVNAPFPIDAILNRQFPESNPKCMDFTKSPWSRTKNTPFGSGRGFADRGKTG